MRASGSVRTGPGQGPARGPCARTRRRSRTRIEREFIIRLAAGSGYDSASWFARMEGLEFDPERLGQRCVACFDMRMEVTAAYALQHGFHAFTTAKIDGGQCETACEERDLFRTRTRSQPR